MKPMFSYFGSKYMLSKRYGKPKFDFVIEPFAGSAAYSLYWDVPKVLLLDANPLLVSLWEYLIRVKRSEILRLPLKFDHVDDLKISQEAKYLIGFWVRKGATAPGLTQSSWGKKYMNKKNCSVWGEPARSRVANQVDYIREWKVKLGTYENSPNVKATWFIDPPYKDIKHFYPYNDINYKCLSKFCRNRKGETIVCERDDAKWLPFKPFFRARGTFGVNRTGISMEGIWRKQ